MVIDAIKNGIVIDHITAGKAMELYRILGLGKLDCTVAILKNVVSAKHGRKDIIKIDQIMDGALDELIDALTAAEQAEKLKAEADEG